jgi:hypothetical protein
MRKDYHGSLLLNQTTIRRGQLISDYVVDHRADN